MTLSQPKIQRVFGSNILGHVIQSPKFVGTNLKLLVPESVRKPTYFVRVAHAGPEAQVSPGDVVLIQPDVGHELQVDGKPGILLQPENIIGRIIE